MELEFPEDLLHYIWKFKKFDLSNLQTTNGDKIELYNGGFHNHDSGPDFLNAKVKIDNKIWFGNIEIHKSSSDWIKHKHQLDKAYNNVILHVVFKHDKDVKTESKQILKVLELESRIDKTLIYNFNKSFNKEKVIPCSENFQGINENRISIYLDKLSIERLEFKTTKIAFYFDELQQNWEALFYKLLFIHFGFKKNNAAFESLSRKVPYKLLKQYIRKDESLEALFFGQAGLLENSDAYSNRLFKEYQYLKKKHQLKSMNKTEWIFFRLRPNNFPTIRIAQLIGFLITNPQIFSEILKLEKLEQLNKLFEIKTSEYWEKHYLFGKKANKSSSALGKTSIHSLIINVVIPITFFYGQSRDEQVFKDKAIDWLNQLKTEKNKIIKNWKTFGIISKNASQSQALIHLNNRYCRKFNCLNCEIGNMILNKGL